MLQIHYSAPDRAITVPEMAEKVGYRGHHGVNLQYGEVGRRLSEELGYAPKKKMVCLSGHLEWLGAGEKTRKVCGSGPCMTIWPRSFLNLAL
jgi:hypothetical protein